MSADVIFTVVARTSALSMIFARLSYESLFWSKRRYEYRALQASPEARLMGEQLLSTGQARFTKAAAVGAQATLGDWKVSPEVQTGSLAAGVAEIALELPTTSSTPTVEVKHRALESTTPLLLLESNKLEVQHLPKPRLSLCFFVTQVCHFSMMRQVYLCAKCRIAKIVLPPVRRQGGVRLFHRL